jgi:hypothetical protein
MGLRVAGFGLDDWIYCTLYIHNSGIQVITALIKRGTTMDH